LQDCKRKRERPRIKSGAGSGGASRERHGWRESIGFGTFQTDSGLCPHEAAVSPGMTKRLRK